ncbi:hypothetical protein DEA8626_03082 [Defluviimonas aquaemixtae]|uniref:Uncharacterized protein n=1 Tax=Albidovulum aquaemixtae TaxID=1542388 RepID=A0A2R8BL04_9RHOB|nr:hypothetical protein [Defluviimonas aquaemixtae]SPH24034.1 hypothetical protein DEA8626_03082 [Defluviimonas aquaemixtae]
MDKIMSLFAFLVLAAFLAILAWYVPSMDLIAVITLTVSLMGYDMLSSAWKKKE